MARTQSISTATRPILQQCRQLQTNANRLQSEVTKFARTMGNRGTSRARAGTGNRNKRPSAG